MNVTIQISDEAVNELINGNLIKVPNEDLNQIIIKAVSEYLNNQYHRQYFLDDVIGKNYQLAQDIVKMIKDATGEITPDDVKEIIKDRAINYIEDCILDKLLFKDNHAPVPEFQKVIDGVFKSEELKLAVHNRAIKLTEEMEDIDLNWNAIMNEIIIDFVKYNIFTHHSIHQAIDDKLRNLSSNLRKTF
ncbi:MAG: hypothetical protein FWC41_00140 [Firmicutes bacterium]|nr:hypothetical protein [Bacillota bacterium]